MYSKLFTKVLDSSIWLESHPTRIVWMTMLACMDEDGMCQFASVVNLARRAIVTTEEARHAVNILESPDLESSDPENEGRRLERVPGGWIVLNAKKYKEIVTSSESRRLARERAQRYRERKAGVTPKRDEDTPRHAASRDERDEVGESNAVITQLEKEKEKDIEKETSTQERAHTPRKAVAAASKRIVQAMNQKSDADLSEMAERIAVAYPRNALKHLGPTEIPSKDLHAIIEAILLESAKQSLKVEHAAELLLNSVEELAVAVPRSEWHFLKPLTAYFGEFEYRRDPTTFKRSTGPKGGSRNGSRDTDGNAEAVRAVLEGRVDGSGGIRRHPEGGDSEVAAAYGGHPRAEAITGSDPDLPSVSGGVDEGADHSGVRKGVGGVQVLSAPSYPPRIQWPGSRR